ncbi:hypothetical protein [Mycolicibacterium llatzerense]|uniref:hypothetical protein n=1 Tax=Mycolicibacterium llatzerense TaxID=280871 RepID=UPI0031CF5CF6
MTRPIAQHLANNPGIAQHLANNLGGDAPMRLHHKVHTLQHGVHGGWLTAIIALLIIGLPFIIALAGIIYRRTQRGSAQAAPVYRPASAAPWQSGTTTPAAAPWQSGMASSAMQPYNPPTYASAPTASTAPAWTAPQANHWAAPAPQWAR